VGSGNHKPAKQLSRVRLMVDMGRARPFQSMTFHRTPLVRRAGIGLVALSGIERP
jgi:hypothetical protein